MAFLFKSKKNSQGSALPQATRNVHTSEGTPTTGTPAATNGVKGEGPTQTTTPSSSYNHSLNSATSPTSPDTVKMRQRSESESQVRTSPGKKQHALDIAIADFCFSL